MWPYICLQSESGEKESETSNKDLDLGFPEDDDDVQSEGSKSTRPNSSNLLSIKAFQSSIHLKKDWKKGFATQPLY